LKMELIEGSETSANHNRTPGKYPKEYIQNYRLLKADPTNGFWHVDGHDVSLCVHFICQQPAYGNASHAHVSLRFINAAKISVRMQTIY